MDTLSYLIENANQVRVDEKLVKQYERQNEVLVNRRIKKSNEKQDTNKPEKQPSPIPGVRPRPLKALGAPRLSPPGSSTHSPKLARPTRPTAKSPQPQPLSAMSEKDLLNLLTTRIDSLRESQRDSEAKYTECIQQFKVELSRCNQEYEQQRQELDKIKSDISTTKKDLASLIHMVQKKSVTSEDEHRNLRSSEKEVRLNGVQIKPQSPGTPRSVLSNFIKIVPAARQ